MGLTGLTGLTGSTGIAGPTGPTGPVTCEKVFECLTSLETNETDCKYCGLYDPSCISFLDDFVGTYSIATALDNRSNLVAGPANFTDPASHLVALNALNIIINSNVIKVTQSPSLINRVYYFNGSNGTGQIVGSFELFATECCPTGVNSDTEVLTKLSDTTLGWVSANCLMKPSIDIEEEISGITQCQNVKTSYSFNVTAPFLNNNAQVFQAPWQISQFILSGQDVTANYSGNFSNYSELGEIFECAGWKQLGENSSIYTKCVFSDTLPTDPTSSIKFIDNNSQIFYCQSVSSNSESIDDISIDDMQMILKTTEFGVILGNPTKILDGIADCSDTSFICKTTIRAACLIEDLTIPSPWQIISIDLNGQPQTPVMSQFSTLEQFQILLIDLGWTHCGSAFFTICQTLPAPTSINSSQITILGNNGITQLFTLESSCQPDCGQTALNRVFLARDANGNYCFASPACFNTSNNTVCGSSCRSTCSTCSNNSLCGATGINGLLQPCGSTGVCDLQIDVPNCIVVPKYELKIRLRASLIGSIFSHFNSTGPLWISKYKLNNGSIITIEEEISTPLSLLTITQAFINLGWVSDLTIDQITNETEEVNITLFDSSNYVVDISVNILGNNGTTLPFDYHIPINCVTDINCPGISSETKILIQDVGQTGFCLVSLDCVLPIVPKPIDVVKEICDIEECIEEPSYRICLKLDECDLIKINDNFDDAENLQITEYKIIGGTVCPVDPAYRIGNTPTLEDLVDALINLGWSSPDQEARPVELFILTDKNIQYVVIDCEGCNPNLPPYAYLIGTSCSEIFNCPSNDPENKVMIKKPDDTICWTPICPPEKPECIIGYGSFFTLDPTFFGLPIADQWYIYDGGVNEGLMNGSIKVDITSGAGIFLYDGIKDAVLVLNGPTNLLNLDSCEHTIHVAFFINDILQTNTQAIVTLQPAERKHITLHTITPVVKDDIIDVRFMSNVENTNVVISFNITAQQIV